MHKLPLPSSSSSSSSSSTGRAPEQIASFAPGKPVPSGNKQLDLKLKNAMFKRIRDNHQAYVRCDNCGLHCNGPPTVLAPGVQVCDGCLQKCSECGALTLVVQQRGPHTGPLLPLCLGDHEVLAREDPQHHSLTRLIRCSSTNCFEWVRPDIHRTVQWLNDPEEYPMICLLHKPPSDPSAAAAVTKSPRSQVKSRPRNDDNDDGGIEILNLVPTHLIPATPKYTVGLDMATLVARSTQRLAAVATKPTSTPPANNSSNKKGSTNKTLVFEGRPPKRRAAVAAEDEIAAAVSTVEAGHSAKRRAAKSIDLNDSDSDSDVSIDNDNGQDASFDYSGANTGDNHESSDDDDDDESNTASTTRRTRTRSAKNTLNWKSTPVLDIVIKEDSVAPLSKFNKPSKPSS